MWMNSEHFNSGSVFRFKSFRLLSSNTTTNNCSAMVRKARKVFLVAAVPMQGRGKAQFTHAAFHFTKASIYENENRGTWHLAPPMKVLKPWIVNWYPNQNGPRFFPKESWKSTKKDEIKPNKHQVFPVKEKLKPFQVWPAQRWTSSWRHNEKSGHRKRNSAVKSALLPGGQEQSQPAWITWKGTSKNFCRFELMKLVLSWKRAFFFVWGRGKYPHDGLSPREKQATDAKKSIVAIHHLWLVQKGYCRSFVRKESFFAMWGFTSAHGPQLLCLVTNRQGAMYRQYYVILLSIMCS